MKLDNVDITKLQLADLPKFNKCPCELCDDGCFDRAGNKHHPECQRRPGQRSKLPLVARCPLSHYKGTFLAATSISGGPAVHRRHPCPPPLDNEIPISFKNAPMSGISSQRDHYQPPPPGIVRPEAAKNAQQTDRLLLSRIVPMETQTNYKVDYVEKPIISKLFREKKDSQINITEPSASISTQTTARTHFKPWQSAPTQPYAEMPSVAGHVLFPGRNRSFETTTQRTFLPFSNISQTKTIFPLDNSGSFKTSDKMDLNTNYRQDYVVPDVPLKRSISNQTKRTSNEQKVYTRLPMNGISQTSFDFRPYSKHRPPLPANTEPFLSQISIGNASVPAEKKESQYRVDYQGYDANEHHRPPAVAPKDHQQPYMTPMPKMDTLTITQRDYQPIDIAALPRIRLVPLKSTISMTDQTSPMENVTMSRYHYQPYQSTISTRRYGELLPNVYIPPMDKFQSTTTTGETYQGHSGPPARPYIPEVRMFNQIGTHDHNTNYRIDYHPHGLSLCAAKAYTIAQNKQTTATSITAE